MLDMGIITSKKDKGHHKMKATHNTKNKQAKPFFPKAASHVPQKLSCISMNLVQQSRSYVVSRLYPVQYKGIFGVPDQAQTLHV